MPEALSHFVGTVLIWIQIIVGLGLLIFIHELGHFLVAKWKGVRVEAFSLGMGPILWKRTWGGTEYRISAIPLGGYVKMAGENIGDPKTGAPDELTSKSGFARLQIFAAGALMNLAIAFPLAILACLAGRSEFAPVAGSLATEETRAGLLPGDVFLEANGRKVVSAEEYRKIIARLPQGTQVQVDFLRNGQRKSVNITARESKLHGILSPLTTIQHVKSGSPVHQAGLRDQAEVLEINGQPVLFSPAEFTEQVAKAAVAGPVTLRVRNPGEEPKTVVLKDLPAPKEEWIDADFRLVEPVILQPEEGTPSFQAGLQAGDTILQVEDTKITSFKTLIETVHRLRGKPVKIKYTRVGKERETEALIRHRSQVSGFLSLEPGRTSRIATVEEDSDFYRAGLRSGDELVEIEGRPGAATVDIARGRKGPVTVTIKRDNLKVTIPGKSKPRLKLEEAGFVLDERGAIAMQPNKIMRTWDFKGAVASGLNEPIELIDLTFRILGKLFVREESATGLAGPVGIFKASFFHAEAGLGNFLWLLVLITVNLGIFNLLPVPVLDGGHILLLAIEKIKGSPPSPRFVERFQLVGLVLLLSLLIFVTINDLR